MHSNANIHVPTHFEPLGSKILLVSLNEHSVVFPNDLAIPLKNCVLETHNLSQNIIFITESYDFPVEFHPMCLIEFRTTLRNDRFLRIMKDGSVSHRCQRSFRLYKDLCCRLK